MDSPKYTTKSAANRTPRAAFPDLIKGLGKVPPQAMEIEEVVLGALMIEKDALTTVIDILKPESFYKEAHQKIYSAIRDLFGKSEPVDLMTVTSQLRTNGDLEFAGGPFYLNQLTYKVNSSANIEYHARIIVEQAVKRELITIASKIETDAFEYTTDVFQLLDRTQSEIFRIAESNIRKSVSNMKDLMRQAMEELVVRSKQKDGLTGVPSGFTALDRVTSGWQKSDLVIIAARPGMGKTAFVVSAMRNAAVQFGKGVAIFSLEMASVQLVNRLLSAEAELGSEKIKKGDLSEAEWGQLYNKTKSLTEAPIFIDDTPALSILELRAKCRRLKAQHDIQLIIIDYLQLMSADSGKGGPGNREQEIAAISRALKQLAKELEVPVLALSQLSRSVETRGGDKRPMLSDLRESGSIEQDADMVIFLYRPEYYKITEDENGNSTLGLGEVIIAKHRNGSLDTVPLRFKGEFTKFSDWETDNFFADGPSFNAFPDVKTSEFDLSGGAKTFESKMNDNLSTGNEFDEPPF
jgi:replicative DNA helicase